MVAPSHHPLCDTARSKPYTRPVDLTDALPGGDLVRQGIADLTRGIDSIPALLVSIGAERLRRAGLALPAAVIASPERRLYDRLAGEDPDGAHSRFNAWIRRLVSCERALECAGR